MKTGRKLALILFPLIACPLLFAAIVAIHYQLAQQSNSLPSSFFFYDWNFRLAFAAVSCLSLGFMAVCLITIKPIWLRLLIAITVTITIAIELPFFGLWVACFNGDCL